MNLKIMGCSLRERSAFTLVELLVVVAILAVLAGLIFPAYRRISESGRATECVGRLRQIGTALNVYLGENNMMMPELKTARASVEDDVAVIDNTLDRYFSDKRVFACPSDPKYAKATGTSYLWNVALNGQPLADLNFFNLAREHSRIPIISDKEGFHPYLGDKVNVLYADGHATKELKFSSETSEPKK